MAEKPLLFLDVDGVLNCFDEDKDHGVLINGLSPQRAYVPHGTKERILSLAQNFDIVWATAWFGQAHPAFRQHLELPTEHWPYLKWNQYKLPELIKFAKDRPWAFVDDDIQFELNGLEWDRDRHIPDNGLLVDINPNHGLSDEHVDKLVKFAQEHS